MLEEAVQIFLNEWQTAFFNPQKRIYWGYLLSALVIAILWFKFYRKLKIVDSLMAIFSREAWLSLSARADYLILLVNSLLMSLLSAQLLAKTTVAYFLFNLLHGVFDGRPNLYGVFPDWGIALSFTLFLFLFDDFARYWLHRWLHTIPTLWAFHKVHHSAAVLNPFTVFRTHPIEAILFSIRGAVVQGISVALFFFWFGEQVTLITVIGANLFNFCFNLLGANLRHSPVPIGYWHRVERWLLSPAQHHIHHSKHKDHIDKNFGVVLAIWDWLFASHCYSSPHQTLRYGVVGLEGREVHTLRMLYWQPFKDAWSSFSQLSWFNRFISYFIRG